VPHNNSEQQKEVIEGFKGGDLVRVLAPFLLFPKELEYNEFRVPNNFVEVVPGDILFLVGIEKNSLWDTIEGTKGDRPIPKSLGGGLVGFRITILFQNKVLYFSPTILNIHKRIAPIDTMRASRE